MRPLLAARSFAARSLAARPFAALLLAASLLALPLGACGGGAESGRGAALGESTRAPDSRPLELALRRPNGAWIHLGDLRGKPVLLFLFATWDGVSQAALRPTNRFARAHGDEVHVIGVAAQPDAPQLLDPYERALQPLFPMAYDPARDVHRGASVLGELEAVPLYVMIDARGFEVDRHVGFPNTSTLENLLRRALRRGGGREDAPTRPLLGGD